jgi:hypothetical protein
MFGWPPLTLTRSTDFAPQFWQPNRAPQLRRTVAASAPHQTSPNNVLGLSNEVVHHILTPHFVVWFVECVGNGDA